MDDAKRSALFDAFYAQIGASQVRRDIGLQRVRGDMYVQGALLDRFGALRHFSEKLHEHRWMSRYLTVTVNLPSQRHHGKRGEFWDSLAHWHVCGYLNADGTGLSVAVVCNFQVLQDFVSLFADPSMGDDVWVQEAEGRRFLRVPIVNLLHNRKAANAIVTYRFDDKAQRVYEAKTARLLMGEDGNKRGDPYTEQSVHTYD